MEPGHDDESSRMRLLVSVEGDGPRPRRDLVVGYSGETTVGDLARRLAADATGAVPANVVALHAADAGPAADPVLFLGDQRLDATTPVDASDLRHGAVVGLGSPSDLLGREPAGLVEVRVTSGPSAGRVHRLGVGRATIGTGRQCTIRTPELPAELAQDAPDVLLGLEVSTDGTVTIHPEPGTADLRMPVVLRREPVTEPIVLEAGSVAAGEGRRKRHRKPAEFRIGDRIDPAAPIPVVHLDRRPVTEPTAWPREACLGVGDALLELVGITEPDASLSPAPNRPELDYNRPPRLHPASRPTEFSIPAEPRRPDRMPFPVTMMLAPFVMSGLSFVFTHSPYTLLMAALSPMMMIANQTGSRKQQKRRYVEQVEEYQGRRVAVEQAAVSSLLGERTARRSTFPDPSTVLLFATGPRARLWERRRWDRDFLHLRVGTTDLPSDVTIKDPARPAHEGELHWTAPDVPATIALGETGVVGVAGSATECRSVAAWCVAQVAALHSPSDVSVSVLAGGDPSPDWDWVKWLPHLRVPTEGGRPFRLGLDEDSRAVVVSALLDELELRRSLEERQRAGLPRQVVVLDGAREIRMTSGVVSLLKDGPPLGIFFVCLDRSVRQLPEECRTVVEWREGTINLETDQQRHIDAIRPDVVEAAWLERLARALAPIRDVSTEDLSAALPAASRLLEVLGLGDEPTGDRVVSEWSGRGRTTRAVIGEGTDGPFRVDVRADGPHGLVAGTTGAGKSELLQTVIASLAYGNRPDEFNFVLVDYKGGAAFKDCDHLPHTVGMVTDLDGHLTTRALESLGAELRVRERQLAAAGAKDIDDYLAGQQAGDDPMPRLLIVIDEFAALVAELPDFVNGLVDVARRGRSLGVHLILATQRPAGVVSAEIKSNTNLRIALRVTDASDSDDVIESPAAAQIAKSFPGRAYARLGHSSLIPFQTARVGGRPEHTGGTPIQVASMDWAALGTLGRPTGEAQEEDEDVSVPTDLASLVGAIQKATAQLGIPEMRRPWLPPLDEQIALDPLLPGPAGEPDGRDAAALVPPIPFGLADLPRDQRQVVESWDLVHSSHLMIAGQSRSGRSNCLRVLAGSIGSTCSPADVHLFGIDAGNNALLPLVALPHVGAIVTRTQVDRLYRLLDHLQRELARRQQLLAESGFADIAEQRDGVAPDERLPYLVVLLDRWEGYVQAFESVDGGVLIDRVTALLQEGAGGGIRVVIAADRTGLIGRVSTLVEDRIALSMSDPGDLSAVGVTAREAPAVMPPGRGFRAGERPREVQWALLDPSGTGTDQVRAIQAIGRTAAEQYAGLPRHRLAQHVDELPAMIGVAEARALPSADPSPSFVAVGVGGDTLSRLGFDPAVQGNGFLVTGPPRSGRSNALQFILSGLPSRLRRTIFVPRRSPLLASPPRGATVFTGAEPAEQITAHLDGIRGDHVVVVDDYEVIGPDSEVGAILATTFARMRDTGSIMLVSASIDDLLGLYRGLPVEMKRGRSGLILAPRAASDGEALGVRLPRSVSGAVPVGRAVLADPAAWSWVQVPRMD